MLDGLGRAAARRHAGARRAPSRCTRARARRDGARRAPACRLGAHGRGRRAHGRRGPTADSTEEKTEQASDRKMKEVRSKGQLGKSQDLTAWVGVGIAGAVIPLTVSAAARAATDQVLSLRTVIENPEPAVALQLAQDALGSVVPTMLPLLGAIAVAVVLLASVAQGGLHLDAEARGRPVQPDERGRADVRGAGPVERREGPAQDDGRRRRALRGRPVPHAGPTWPRAACRSRRCSRRRAPACARSWSGRRRRASPSRCSTCSSWRDATARRRA